MPILKYQFTSQGIKPALNISLEIPHQNTNLNNFMPSFKTIPILDKTPANFFEPYSGGRYPETIARTPDVIFPHKDNKTFLKNYEVVTKRPSLSLGRSEHELAKQLIAALKSLATYIKIGASGPSNI